MTYRVTRGQRGLSLIEIILLIAIVAAASVAAFVFHNKTSVRASVEVEQRQVADLVKTVDSVFATQPNFSALGTNGAQFLQNRDASRYGVRLSGGAGAPALTTALGSGQLHLSSWDVPGASGVVANGGYRLAYPLLGSNECTNLVAATHQIAFRVGVSNRGLNDSAATIVSERGKLTVGPDTVAQACKKKDPAVFLYFAPSRGVGATTPPPPPVPPACRPTTERRSAACPAGEIGSILQERMGSCTGPNNSLVFTAWTDVSSTCAPEVVAPATVTPTAPVDNCTTSTFTRVQACPAGQTGQILQERTLDTCAGSYTPWTTVSSNCQATPTASCTPASEERTLACGGGMTGSIREIRSSSCPSPTAAPVWSSWQAVSNTCSGNGTCLPQRESGPIPCATGYYGPLAGNRERFLNCASSSAQASSWTAWTVLVPNNGCTACPPNTNETQTRWQARSQACPSGQVGTNTWEAQQVRTRTVSYNCPTGTVTLPGPSYSSWGAYSDTGAVRNTVNTCTPQCTPPASTTEVRNQPCPSGQVGTIVENRTTSWTCPSTTGSPVSTTSGWVVVSNTCASTCVVPTPATQTNTENRVATQTVPCPAGQTGTHTQTRNETRTQTRTASCPSSTGPVSWTAWSAWSAWTATSSWVTSSNTCKVSDPAVITSESFSGYAQVSGCPIYGTNLPAGWAGGWVAGSTPQLMSITMTRTRTYSGGVYGAWSAWSVSMGGTTCASKGSLATPSYPNSVPALYTTQSRTVTSGCPVGTGTMSWTQNYLVPTGYVSGLPSYPLLTMGGGGVSNITYNCVQ